MRVVLPDSHLRAIPVPRQVGHKRTQCPSHVAVTQIPRRDSVSKHHAVVLLGILCQPCILLSVEKLILRHTPVASCIVLSVPLQFNELVDHFILARFGEAEACTVSILLCLLTKFSKPP